ncbi:hypothetical protein BGX27_008014 [Mortierella sp. AM989]|nr:hypothetical protein BGX27_008014 [Mortierella sp. AM989]
MISDCNNNENSNDTASPPLYYGNTTRTFYPLTGIRPISPSYIAIASKEPVRLEKPQKLLVILDLNGTLFYRSADKKRKAYERPYLSVFLKFLFENCRVMIWSSARPASVERMLKTGFSNRIPELDRVWSRTHFKLHQIDYNRKVLTLKDLEFVWEAIEIERQNATAKELMVGNKYGVHYDQTNTVLIDDSIHKSQLQPFNRIVLTDYDHGRYLAGTDFELLKVKKYLEQLIMQQNVSAYIKRHPFDPASKGFEAEEFKTIFKAVADNKKRTEKERIRKKLRKEALTAGSKHSASDINSLEPDTPPPNPIRNKGDRRRRKARAKASQTEMS